MKKVISALLAALLLAALLSGCHGARDQGTFAIPETFDESRSYEITFWAKNDTNVTQANIYKQAIADFQKLYPSITVNLRLYTDYSRIYNDVITNIATNTTPNVCITYPDHIATYLTGNDAVVPLDSLFRDPRYGLGGSALRFDGPTQEEIIPQFLAECAIGGTHYAIPYMRSPEACYINKDFVEALGYQMPEVLTWDFIWEVSEAATAKNADGTYRLNGQNVMIPFIYKSTDNMMIQQLRQLDAPYATAAGDIQIFNDTTRELLMTAAEHTKSGSFSTFKISSYPANFLNAGQCVFAIDSTAGATWMGSGAPLLDISPDQLVEFETAVRPVPQFDPDNMRMISQGPSVCVFNKSDSQEVLASWLFAQFLLTNDVQIAYATTEGYVPVTAKAQGSETYQDYLSRAGEDGNEHYDVKIAASRLLLEHTDDTFVTPVFNGSASLRSAAGQMIEEVVKAIRRSQPVNDETIDALYEKMTALYRLDQIQSGNGKAELGPLPVESRVLLWTLGLCWAGILTYLGLDYRKKKRKSRETH